MTNRCAFWIASQKYIEEAKRSASRFRQLMPDITTAIIYVDPFELDNLPEFDRVIGTPRMHKYWYLDSVSAMNLAVEKIQANLLYFDTDTYLVEPVYELFEMLEHGFDFIAAHAPGRHTAPTVNPIPDAFPEFNVGVCGFSASKKTRDFIAYWYRTYSKNQDLYGNNDQAPLREVLWDSGGIDIATLPPEYNCRFGFGCFLRYPAKVLHGRHPDMEAVARSINAEQGMRVWKPSDMG